MDWRKNQRLKSPRSFRYRWWHLSPLAKCKQKVVCSIWLLGGVPLYRSPHRPSLVCRLREKLAEVCEILGIKFTTPEKFVSHRWMTCYDIAAGTLRLWDAYYVFYFGFLKLEDRNIYKPVIRKILNDRKVSELAKAKLDSVHNNLKKKSMTSDGKMRKTRIFEKVVYFLLKRYSIMEINMYDNVWMYIIYSYTICFWRCCS